MMGQCRSKEAASTFFAAGAVSGGKPLSNVHWLGVASASGHNKFLPGEFVLRLFIIPRVLLTMTALSVHMLYVALSLSRMSNNYVLLSRWHSHLNFYLSLGGRLLSIHTKIK
jgi:hypothetical protein